MKTAPSVVTPTIATLAPFDWAELCAELEKLHTPAHTDGMTMGELCDALHIRRKKALSLIQYGLDKGFVKRVPAVRTRIDGKPTTIIVFVFQKGDARVE